MIVRENFEIVFRDRDECEFLLALVMFRDVVICEINREKGAEHMEVEFFFNDPLYNDLNIKFPLDDFVEALSVAKEALMDR